MARALIDGGADLETPGGSVGTPLDNAIGYGCWHVTRLLMQQGRRRRSLRLSAPRLMVQRPGHLVPPVADLRLRVGISRVQVGPLQVGCTSSSSAAVSARANASTALRTKAPFSCDTIASPGCNVIGKARRKGPEGPGQQAAHAAPRAPGQHAAGRPHAAQAAGSGCQQPRLAGEVVRVNRTGAHRHYPARREQGKKINGGVSMLS